MSWLYRFHAVQRNIPLNEYDWTIIQKIIIRHISVLSSLVSFSCFFFFYKYILYILCLLKPQGRSTSSTTARTKSSHQPGPNNVFGWAWQATKQRNHKRFCIKQSGDQTEKAQKASAYADPGQGNISNQSG
jgi:hypothetical protein